MLYWRMEWSLLASRKRTWWKCCCCHVPGCNRCVSMRCWSSNIHPTIIKIQFGFCIFQTKYELIIFIKQLMYNSCPFMYLNSSMSYSPWIRKFLESNGDLRCSLAGYRTPSASISYSPLDNQAFVTLFFSGCSTYLKSEMLWTRFIDSTLTIK